VTALVVIAKVAELAPEAILTVEGMDTELRLLLRVTLNPAVGAGPLRFTVPVEEPPPATVVGLTVNPVNAAGLIVKDALIDVVPRLAVILAVVFAVTPVVVIENVAAAVPDGITTLL
jgi:hypothetical protein